MYKRQVQYLIAHMDATSGYVMARERAVILRSRSLTDKEKAIIWLPGVAGLVTLILLAAARLVFMLAATRLAWRSINSLGPCVYA